MDYDKAEVQKEFDAERATLAVINEAATDRIEKTIEMSKLKMQTKELSDRAHELISAFDNLEETELNPTIELNFRTILGKRKAEPEAVPDALPEAVPDAPAPEAVPDAPAPEAVQVPAPKVRVLKANFRRTFFFVAGMASVFTLGVLSS